MLIPNSHSKLMTNIFGAWVLDEIHDITIPALKSILDPESELKFREAIKLTRKESLDSTIKWLMGELLNNPTLGQNLGQLMLECL